MKIDGFKHVVIIPDTQWPFQNDKTEACLLDYIRKTKPEKLIHIGDAVDFFSLSTFRKALPQSERLHLLEELKIAREKFKLYAAAAPRAEKILIMGNHDERLNRYMEQEGGELFELHNDVLSYGSLTGCEAAGWTVVGPYGKGIWVGKPGGLWATHGDLARKWSGASAKAHIEKYGHSIVHGHTHRLGKFYNTTAVGTIVGIEVGTIADMKKTPRATETVDWQYGFCSVWVSEKSPRFHAELIEIIDGGCVSGGKYYGK